MNWMDAYKIGRAFVRVLGNSGRTTEILRVGEMTGRPRYRQILAEMGEREDMKKLMRERPKISPESVDFDRLRALPAHTLGNAYIRHVDGNNLTIDPVAMAPRFTEDQDIAYLIHRFRQSHDIWHALIGVGITGHEEVLVHAFSWGQLRIPVSAFVVFFGSIKHMVLERRWLALRYALLEAYQNGRTADPLLPVYWEDLWDEPLEMIRKRYNIRPCTAAYVHG